MCEWDNLTEMCSLKRCQHGNVEDCEFATNGGAEDCTRTTPVSHMILISMDTHEKEFRAIHRTR